MIAANSLITSHKGDIEAYAESCTDTVTQSDKSETGVEHNDTSGVESCFVISGERNNRERCDTIQSSDSTDRVDNARVEPACAVTTRAQRLRDDKPREPLSVPVVVETGITVSEFREIQRLDELLEMLWQSAKWETLHESAGPGRNWFRENEGSLFRYYRLDVAGEVRRQLVVPRTLRAQVLKVGHETIPSGHQRVKKTLDRIMLNFFWPGIYGDVKRYCASCDICQRTIPRGTVSKVPVERIPVVKVPFEKVAIDLIGPLNRGHRWILTLVDFATRYPEAVALKPIDTEVVAEALVGIFSHVGLPTEIISDNGSQFVSGLMKEVARLLSIRWVHTIPYHPQSNGLCEKWNGTLKRMLRRMSSERTRDWDRYLEPLMFAYREAPQQSTKLSQFELLHTRNVRGPMAILRDLWSNEKADTEVKNVYRYTFDLRNRIEETCKLKLVQKWSKIIRVFHAQPSVNRYTIRASLVSTERTGGKYADGICKNDIKKTWNTIKSVLGHPVNTVSKSISIRLETKMNRYPTI